MLDLDEAFVVDAAAHAYNYHPSNYHNEKHARWIAEMLYESSADSLPENHTITRESYYRDWSVEELANMLFLESQTDVAVFQPVQVTAFEDGLVRVEKAEEAIERWPHRFLAYAAVDPLEGEGVLGEIDRQADRLDPEAVKLYPYSWGSDYHEGWTMDDPDVAFPVFERALDNGIDVISVHKAIPLGRSPMKYFEPGDVEQAAESFPEITFEIVHGGASFTEETAWQLARFPNVRVNLETTNKILATSPDSYLEMLAGLLRIGGEDVLDRIHWGTGVVAYPPQLSLEDFQQVEFPERVVSKGGYFEEVPQLTDEAKRKILGLNFAEMVGLDVEATRERIADDEFSRRRREEGLAEPFSTTGATVEEGESA